MAAKACIRACIMHQMAACAMSPKIRVEGQVGWTAIKVDTTPACGYASCKTNLEPQCLEMAVQTNLCGQMLESELEWVQACMWNWQLHVNVAFLFPCQQVCGIFVYVTLSTSVLRVFAVGQQVAHRRSKLMRLFMSEGCLHKSQNHDIGCWLFSRSILLHYLF